MVPMLAGVFLLAFVADGLNYLKNTDAQTPQEPFEPSKERNVQDIVELCEPNGGRLEVNNIGGADCLFDHNASTDSFLSGLEAKGYDTSGSELYYYSIEGPDDSNGICAMVGPNNVGPEEPNKARRFGSACG